MKTLIKMANWPGRFLDQTGMYRVVTLTLVGLVIFSLVFSLIGLSAYTFKEQVISLLVVLVSTLIANAILAKILGVKPNHESNIITALILFFLFTPAIDLVGQYVIALSGVIAVVSKYLIAPRGQHIFNPAAFGAAALSFTGWHEAWWWIASPEMFIPLLIAGLAVLAKVRRFKMAAACVTAGLAVVILEAGAIESATIQRFFLTGPMLFLVFFMLTEPFTTPPRKHLQLGYGVLVGVLMSTSLFAPIVAMTPEFALLIGNLAFYQSTLRQKLRLKFIDKQQIADNTYELRFEKPPGMKFVAGQYLEWMLAHQRPDSRGVRRYLTVASAPEEAELRIALRVMPEGGSSYKRELMELKPGEEVIASQLAGDFVLPKDEAKKCAFVAGGIGVTPFRSHIGHMFKTGVGRDIHLYYANNLAKDIAYRDLFSRAEQELGMKWINVLKEEKISGYENGYLTEEMIKCHTPDYAERTWYLSGPPGMVNAYKKLLRGLGVPRRNIVTDFFPGLA